mmetsp:Transcript_39278/g.122953  ORF Transcript_39278/g.122953 Transcript_39278/m.122953 type:complete len:501 (-) Transcript_39278:1051-2553(-)
MPGGGSQFQPTVPQWPTAAVEKSVNAYHKKVNRGRNRPAPRSQGPWLSEPKEFTPTVAQWPTKATEESVYEFYGRVQEECRRRGEPQRKTARDAEPRWEKVEAPLTPDERKHYQQRYPGPWRPKRTEPKWPTQAMKESADAYYRRMQADRAARGLNQLDQSFSKAKNPARPQPNWRELQVPLTEEQKALKEMKAKEDARVWMPHNTKPVAPTPATEDSISKYHDKVQREKKQAEMEKRRERWQKYGSSLANHNRARLRRQKLMEKASAKWNKEKGGRPRSAGVNGWPSMRVSQSVDDFHRKIQKDRVQNGLAPFESKGGEKAYPQWEQLAPDLVKKPEKPKPAPKWRNRPKSAPATRTSSPVPTEEGQAPAPAEGQEARVPPVADKSGGSKARPQSAGAVRRRPAQPRGPPARQKSTPNFFMQDNVCSADRRLARNRGARPKSAGWSGRPKSAGSHPVRVIVWGANATVPTPSPLSASVGAGMSARRSRMRRNRGGKIAP